MPVGASTTENRRVGSLLQKSIETARSVRARLQSCRKGPINNPALAAAESQITENRTAQAKAQHDFAVLAARLKSCPDTIYSLMAILQEALCT